MSKSLGSILKLVISLGLGIFIVWLTVGKLTPEQIEIVKSVFGRANYGWVIAGPLIGMLSNVVRAERWKMLLNSVGYTPKRSNVLYSVFVMYAGNLLFPRLGEVTRCTLLYKTDDIPVDKSIGTMVLERLVDMVLMLLVGVLLMFFQYELLFSLLNDKILSHYMSGADQSHNSFLGVLLLLLLISIAGGILYFFYWMREHHIIGRVWTFLQGIWQGLASISKLENPFLFLVYSVLIWVMYFFMLYTCYQALPETAGLNVWSGLACLFFGGFAFIVSQGGIGAYPATLAAVLVLYGIAYEVGFAFGWLVWSLQTAAVILFGVISFILVSRNFTISAKKEFN